MAITNKIIFLLESVKSMALRPPVGAEVKGEPVEVIRMLCLGMEQYEEVKIAILSAAKNYMKEHNIQTL